MPIVNYYVNEAAERRDNKLRLERTIRQGAGVTIKFNTGWEDGTPCYYTVTKADIERAERALRHLRGELRYFDGAG